MPGPAPDGLVASLLESPPGASPVALRTVCTEKTQPEVSYSSSPVSTLSFKLLDDRTVVWFGQSPCLQTLAVLGKIKNPRK